MGQERPLENGVAMLVGAIVLLPLVIWLIPVVTGA
jgi:hypothetical protein